MASVALFLHRYRPEAISLGETTTAWLRAHGHDVVVVDEGTVSPGADGLASPFDLVVALGGDGTLLRAVSHVLASGAPVLGVNIGRLGYLTQTEPSNLEVALDRFFAGEFTIEERMTVAVSAHDPDGVLLASQVVLNEATIEKTVPGHMSASVPSSTTDRSSPMRPTGCSWPPRPDQRRTTCRRAVRSSLQGSAP